MWYKVIHKIAQEPEQSKHVKFGREKTPTEQIPKGAHKQKLH